MRKIIICYYGTVIPFSLAYVTTMCGPRSMKVIKKQ